MAEISYRQTRPRHPNLGSYHHHRVTLIKVVRCNSVNAVNNITIKMHTMEWNIVYTALAGLRFFFKN